MENIYFMALDLAGYELERGIALEIQFRNMFLDCVGGGMFSDICNENDVDDLIEEMGLDGVARMMVKKMRNYCDFKKIVGIG